MTDYKTPSQRKAAAEFKLSAICALIGSLFAPIVWVIIWPWGYSDHPLNALVMPGLFVAILTTGFSLFFIFMALDAWGRK